MAKNNKTSLPAESSSPAEPNTSYEVGYGKPPLHSRFPKGKSGNPSGRRKKRVSLDAKIVLEKLCSKPVHGQTNGKAVTMSTFEVVLNGCIKSAANGNLKALDFIITTLAKNPSLTDLMAGRAPFEYTPEERERFEKANLIRGLVLPDEETDEEGEDKE